MLIVVHECTDFDFMIKAMRLCIFKASLGSKRILFSYFIITEPTELKLS